MKETITKEQEAFNDYCDAMDEYYREKEEKKKKSLEELKKIASKTKYSKVVKYITDFEEDGDGEITFFDDCFEEESSGDNQHDEELTVFIDQWGSYDNWSGNVYIKIKKGIWFTFGYAI